MSSVKVRSLMIRKCGSVCSNVILLCSFSDHALSFKCTQLHGGDNDDDDDDR